MYLSTDGIWVIIFIVLIVIAIFSVLVCFISCCYAHDCFCGCFHHIALFFGCVERDYAYEGNVTCCGHPGESGSESNNMFNDCRMVKYYTDSIICGCFTKQSSCRNSVCTICLEDYILGENLILCPCGHCYHKRCIKGWLRIKNICPLCKVLVNQRNLWNERSPLLYNV